MRIKLMAAVVGVAALGLALLIINPQQVGIEEANVIMVNGSWEKYPEQEYFKPMEIVFAAGRNNTVVWTNMDFSGGALHNVLSDENLFSSPLLAPGESWSHTFQVAGEYNYYCEPHPWMVGKIIVRATRK